MLHAFAGSRFIPHGLEAPPSLDSGHPRNPDESGAPPLASGSCPGCPECLEPLTNSPTAYSGETYTIMVMGTTCELEDKGVANNTTQ